ncbi:MAG TPA: HNH endonuclease [Candidatus Corynebacterium avicola]|uniref:HNH endonuclease n=1 Tax=Candidatus Corynebacterium avicola TaxID=2838527 RepID=A0A9D1RQC6_9CORY|nr:HNH endonuclease [Candidatus Corynebacterium avicola]
MAFVAAAEELVAQGQDAWDRLGVEERETLFREIESARRSLAVVDTRFLCAHESVIPEKESKKVSWLVDRMHIVARDARTRVRSVRRLDPRGDVFSADPTVPSEHYMPTLAEAVEAGSIGAETVAELDRALDALPAPSQERVTAVVDRELVPALQVDGPGQVRRIRPWLLGLVGEDEPYTQRDHQRMRSLVIGEQQYDGMTPIRGLLTPESAAALQGLMADYATAGKLVDAEGTLVGASGECDPADDVRTPEQRQHDAFAAVIAAGYRPDGTMRPGRGKTTIVAAMTLDQLLEGTGVAPTDVGVRVPVSALVEGTDAQNFFCQVMDLEGQTLALGRSCRLGSLAQYLALFGEEGGSSAPGSSTPAARCHIHHIDGWEHGGTTDLPNLTLVDAGNHARVNDARDNPDRVETRRAPKGSGARVHWVPPASEDPKRTPRAPVCLAFWDTPGVRIRRVRRAERKPVPEDPPDDNGH